MSEKRETLGDNVIPIRYEMEFEPDLNTFRFEGRETIEVEVKKFTNAITLNAAELAIREATIESGNAKQKAAVSLDAKNERATLKVKEGVRGKARITLRFSGTNNDKMYGFYRSKYLAGGREKYLLTTQFEAADARKAFPCFDEPRLKAVFTVSMVVDRGLECISNMPVAKKTRLAKGKKRVSFLPTPRMSTYLVYLGVGNYDSVEGTLGKVKVRVLMVKGKRDLGHMALDYAKKFVRYYEGYFGLRYQLPKLDLIAIPDFSMGAMENWGAITFRESGLLGNAGSAVATKQRIATVIAHELAHQWFGDLVTMEWWDDLWLNESFADYMSCKAMQAVMPEWDMETQYLEDSVATAFSADQLRSTHPISVSVGDPKEIAALFDSISYDKGGTVLRMLEDYVGPDVFRKGLHEYLKSHAYANATKGELWKKIDAAAKRAHRKTIVDSVASYWIETPGYPVVSVERRGKDYLLRQNRFIISGGGGSPSRWPIPVHYENDSKKGAMFLMDGATHTIRGATAEKWIKLNFRQKGLYRVRYEGALLERLGAAIRDGELDGIDAWGVESDLFSLARSGRMMATDYLDFVRRYCFDCGYPLSSTLLGHLSWLYGTLYTTELAPAAREPLVEYSRLLLGRLGMERRAGEKNVDTMLRGSALLNLGLADDAETVAMSNHLFDDFMEGGADIDKNLRGAVYKIAAWTGGEDVFGKLVAEYRKETIIDEKMRLLGALGFFRELPLLSRALSFALSKDVRYQDVFYVPGNASGNPLAAGLLWKWTSGNWKKLMARYPAGLNILNSFVSYMSAQSTGSARREIAAFFARKSNLRKDFEPELRRTLERIDTNIRFMRKNGV